MWTTFSEIRTQAGILPAPLHATQCGGGEEATRQENKAKGDITDGKETNSCTKSGDGLQIKSKWVL